MTERICTCGRKDFCTSYCGQTGAFEIAEALRQAWMACAYRMADWSTESELDTVCGGGSMDGQFNLSLGGRKFSVHVSECEDI